MVSAQEEEGTDRKSEAATGLAEEKVSEKESSFEPIRSLKDIYPLAGQIRRHIPATCRFCICPSSGGCSRASLTNTPVEPFRES